MIFDKHFDEQKSINLSLNDLPQKSDIVKHNSVFENSLNILMLQEQKIKDVIMWC